MLRGEDDGSEQPSSSDPGLSLHLRNLVRRMVREEIQREINLSRGQIQLIVINTVQRVINPAVQGLLRTVIQEELQKVLPQGTRNDVPEERRSLHLKFLDEVSGPVLTSKDFKGKDGPLKVALFDATGNPVTTGPESSAEVEILLIDDNERNTMDEDFERRIIRAGDKGKPHFAKNVYVKLDKGEAELINQKLGQESGWTKIWTCRLGARFVKDFRGLNVQEAWTEPFEVKDNRIEWSKKHEPPRLTSEVWRLKGIGRDGEPHKRLGAAEIKTVQDFLFWHSVNPKELQKILGAGDKKWNTIEDYAKTCIIDDDKRMFCHKSSTEPLLGVIYDSVGDLKGVIIDESHFVPLDDLSADEKDQARKLLLSLVLEPDAFVGRYQTFFTDEASLVQQHPLYKSSGDSIQQCLNPMDPGCSSQSAILDPENIDGYFPTCQPSGYENAVDSDDSLDLWIQQLICSGCPSPNPGNIPTASLDECFNDGMHQMTKHASKRWIKLKYVLLMVSINVTHPKRKKQRVG